MAGNFVSSCKPATDFHEKETTIDAPNDKGSKRSYRQLYRKDWEKNPLFKGWLCEVPSDKYKAVCLACKKELLAHRLTLLKHASSAKHLRKLDSLKRNNLLSKSEDNECTQIEETRVNVTTNSSASLPELDLANTDTLTSSDKEFSTEMVLAHSQTEGLFVNAVATVQQTLEKTYENSGVSTESRGDNLGMFIPTETYVDMSDSSEAINVKPGYVAKSSKNTILCASSFLNEKLTDGVNEGVINKITAIPLQVSTKVTDYSRGISVTNLNVTLYKLCSGKWMCVSESVTDEVGRCNLFPKSETYFAIGCYKLHYDVATYYELQNLKSYFPFIEISFLLRSPSESHHIPLMISPNGYTAYRSLDF